MLEHRRRRLFYSDGMVADGTEEGSRFPFARTADGLAGQADRKGSRDRVGGQNNK